MLKESERGTLVDDIKDEVDFTYVISESLSVDPGVKVYRYGEGFSRKHPTVLIQYLPANKKKFQSVSDIIGFAKGDYYLYGFCHIELCSIHCYCQETHKSADKSIVLNGRLLCMDMAEKILKRVMFVWEGILDGFYASFDRKDTVPAIKQLYGYDPTTETKFYNCDIDVYLRTQFNWDKVPEDYDDEGDLAEKAEIEVKEVNSNKKIIINIGY